MTSTGLWHPSSVDLITEQVVEHIWRVEFPTLTGGDVPAWDIEVDLDGGRSPYGEARFKTPTAYIAETVDGDGTIFTKLVPKMSPPVRIWAGWRHVVDGHLVDDLQILFAGFITARRLRLVNGQSYVEFAAQTTEARFDYPLHRAWEFADSYTRVKQVVESSWSNSNPWYRSAYIIEEAGWMNTPTSAQLSAARAMAAAAGDNAGDFIRAMAAQLGQWVRGNVRSTTTDPEWLISADPYPYREILTLPAQVFTEIDRIDDVDDWANLLQLSATWTSSGDPVTKKQTYVGAGVAGAANTGSPLIVRSKAVTIEQKPTGGTLGTDNPLGLAWLRRVQDMSEVAYTATGRAIWWLQPRIHGIAITGLGLSDAAGPLDRLVYRVDEGTMTATWSTDNTRT